MKNIAGRSAILLLSPFVFSCAAHAASLSASALADNCKVALDQFNEKHFDAARLARIRTDSNTPIFAATYEITIGDRVVPVFPFAKGISNSTLIALIHGKPHSDPEQPSVDAICPDYTGHKFTYDANTHTLDFSSGKGEKLTLLFRLDPATLSHTTWMSAPGDSIWMVEIPIPPPNPLPKPNSSDWCDKTQPKDAAANKTDMWFTMCVQHGTPREFEYTLRLLVNGKVFPIDPQIINRPF